MDHPESAPTAGAPARRANILMLLFLFFLVLTVLCLHALRDPPASAPPPSPAAVEYAAFRS